MAHFLDEEGLEQEGDAVGHFRPTDCSISPGAFQETFDHLQQGLRSLLAMHNREVFQLRSENTKLRASIRRVSTRNSNFSTGEAVLQRISLASSAVSVYSDEGSNSVEAVNEGSARTEELRVRPPGRVSMMGSTPASRGDAAVDLGEGFPAAGDGRKSLRTDPMAESQRGDEVNAETPVLNNTLSRLNQARIFFQTSASQSMHLRSARFFLAKRPQLNNDSMFTRVVTSEYFEFILGFCILLNCASMGLEAEFLVAGGTKEMATMLEISEHIFTLIFLVELLLRARVYGWRSYLPIYSVYNFLDAVLVLVTGVIFAWIWPLVLRFSGTTGEEGTLRVLTVLRAFRLVRLARVVRNFESFSEAWLLIRGLTNSVRTLVWTIVVIFMLAYTFAVFGLALMGKEFVRQYKEAEVGSQTQAELFTLVGYTGRLDRLLFTLIQLLTMDNWSEVVRLSVKYLVWSWIYFYFYLGVVVIVLMNLVTAIIVENALLTSKMDEDKQLAQKDSQKKQELNKLKQIFLMMDVDGDGTLSWDEFEAAFQQEDILNKWKLLDFQPDECRDLFKLLDRGDGCISLTDFHDGLLRMRGAAQSKDMFQVMKYLGDLTMVVSEIAEAAQRDDRGPRERRRKHRPTAETRALPSQEEDAAVHERRVGRGSPRASKKENADTAEESYVL